MKEIHFFENKDDEDEWVMGPENKSRPVWVANDFAGMKRAAGHLSEVYEYIATIQMCYLDTSWFEEGFRIFVHDYTGKFEIVLGDGNERTSRWIRPGHSLYRLWIGGEFGYDWEESK